MPPWRLTVIDRIVHRSGDDAALQPVVPSGQPSVPRGTELLSHSDDGDHGPSRREAGEQTLHWLDAHIRRRLRAIVLKHWKRRRTIVRRLTRLGAKASTARVAVYGQNKSWRALSLTRPVSKALSGAYFRERDLLPLKEHWQEMRDQSVIGPIQRPLDRG